MDSKPTTREEDGKRRRRVKIDAREVFASRDGVDEGERGVVREVGGGGGGVGVGGDVGWSADETAGVEGGRENLGEGFGFLDGDVVERENLRRHAARVLRRQRRGVSHADGTRK